MIKELLAVLVFVAGIFPVAIYAVETQHEKTEREAAENKTARIQERLRAADNTIRFYGRVLDQYDQPVADADVELHITKFGLNPASLFSQVKKFQVKTDFEGNFKVSKEAGRSLYVNTIQKEGFEFLFEQNRNRGFDYDSSEGQAYHIPDEANPVVFHLRKKKQTPGFLFHQNYLDLKIQAGESGRMAGYDFIKEHRLDDVRERVFNGEPVFPDIQCKATFNTNDAIWTVVLSPGNTNGGIIMSEEKHYEAPESGYQPEVAFIPENWPKVIKAKYVYLRSRDPFIFTRIEIRSIQVGGDRILLSVESVTNPYGDRNLERATDLPGEVDIQLENEVRSTFRADKRPVRPDLPKLVREAKEKRGK